MRGELFLGKLVASLREAYPEVRTARLNVVHHGDVDHESQRERVYSTVPGKIPCPNPRCRGGGYDLNTTLLTLTQAKTTSYRVTWNCGGREGSRRTQVNPYPCMNSVELSLEITYHE
jgi:hypothetical protein